MIFTAIVSGTWLLKEIKYEIAFFNNFAIIWSVLLASHLIFVIIKGLKILLNNQRKSIFLMESQIRISDLENIISEKVFIKIEKWNLYLGDAGLARPLAIECISNKDQGSLKAAKISLNAINVKVGDGVNSIPLINLVTNSQIIELEEILESFFYS